MKILPYKRYSKSAKALRMSLGMKVVHPDLSPKGRDSVLNWGCAKSKPNAVCKFFNQPEKVTIAVNKLSSFKALKDAGVNVPEFSTRVEDAKAWIENDYKVLARYLLRGHSGRGIKIVDCLDNLPGDAPLYVRYYRKKHEFRVHVVNGEVIDYVEKKKRNGVDAASFNKYIRSYDNGWVFCRDDIVDIPEIRAEAIKAVNALGLDFGAVDIIWTKSNKAMVLEVNSAPALSGTTLVKYTEAIRNLME